MGKLPDYFVEKPTTFFSTRDKFMETYEDDTRYWEGFVGYQDLRRPYRPFRKTDPTSCDYRNETTGQVFAKYREDYRLWKLQKLDEQALEYPTMSIIDIANEIIHWEKQEILDGR
jgi:hypothetical protein